MVYLVSDPVDDMPSLDLVPPPPLARCANRLPSSLVAARLRRLECDWLDAKLLSMVESSLLKMLRSAQRLMLRRQGRHASRGGGQRG